MFSVTFCFTSYAQSMNNRLILGKHYAENELESALTDSTQHNLIKTETVIVKDSTTAVAIAEPILFGMYGKENIINQKPYEIYHIKHHWIVTGTLPKDWRGGTFLLIMKDSNAQVIKITHGK